MVKQRLEEVVIALVEQRDLDPRNASQIPRGAQARESTPYDHDMRHDREG
jgi:hypothetical protein